MASKIFEYLKKEEVRQRDNLLMIPSENYSYPEVRKVLGSALMHKYAEGYPGKRYYQGMEFVDGIEEYCKNNALKTFGLKDSVWRVNVQPYSGSPANLEVFNAVLKPNDKILSLSLLSGGHLSHGWRTKDKNITLISKIYDVSFYEVNQNTGVLDYDEVEKIAKKVKPKIITSGGTSYPREINHKKLSSIAKSVKALYLADVSHEAGLIAGKMNTSPFAWADFVTMTTHKTLRGPRGAIIFARRKYIDDINASVFPGIQGGPHMHTIAGIAIALEKAQTKEFEAYIYSVVENARRLSEKLISLGYNVVTGGTDKHLILVDLRNRKINGWFAAIALEHAGIVLNRNAVPGDTASSYYPSGVRLGTPAITARGMGASEMDKIAEYFDAALRRIGTKEIPKDKEMRSIVLNKFKKDIAKDSYIRQIRLQVKRLCQKYPILFD